MLITYGMHFPAEVHAPAMEMCRALAITQYTWTEACGVCKCHTKWSQAGQPDTGQAFRVQVKQASPCQCKGACMKQCHLCRRLT